jgi:hypothetical protein
VLGLLLIALPALGAGGPARAGLLAAAGLPELAGP